MSTNVSAIPKGFHAVTPYLIVKGADQAIEFYKKAFGAVEGTRLEAHGMVMYAQLEIFGSKLMLSEEAPEWGNLGPSAERSSSVTVHFVCRKRGSVVRASSRGRLPITVPHERCLLGRSVRHDSRPVLSPLVDRHA